MSNQLGFIHRFIPPSSPSNPITILLLHGTGADENNMIPIGRMISPNAALLSPRGKVLENGMTRFFRRFAEGVFDQEDLKYRTNELAAFIKQASEKYKFELDRLVVIGYSNGANIAASIILRHPGLINEAVLFHPVIPFVPKKLPDLSSTRILVTAGKNDPIVRTDESENLKKLFENCGADVEIYWHDKGHNLRQEEIIKAKDFLGISINANLDNNKHSKKLS